MSYESTAEPIKLGYLFDFSCRPGFPKEMRADLTQSFDLVFEEGLEQGLIDRPVEIVFREVEGLPKGSVKAVIDAYGELVDEGCLAVFGPHITDNCVPTREAIEDRFQVPAISVTGTDDWLGEWTFALPMGSMTDEPIFWADLLAKRGLTDVGVLVEQSLVGETYLKNLRTPAGARASASSPRSRSRRPPRTSARLCSTLHDAKVEAFVHCGFGFGIVLHQPGARGSAGTHRGSSAPRSRTHGSTRSCGTPSSGGSVSTSTTRGTRSASISSTAMPIGTAASSRYCVPVVNRDSPRRCSTPSPMRSRCPRGVKEALERVRMLPAASGAPGTRVSFGKWTHRGWMGAGYLVARPLDPDGINAHLVERFGEEADSDDHP